MDKPVVFFKRREKKYLINKEEYIKILDSAKEYLKTDKYSESTINNIYLDTDDYLLTRRSIEKPDYKEKLRVRGYQDIQNDSKVFLEVKKKCEGIGYKKRVHIRLNELNKKIFLFCFSVYFMYFVLTFWF